jgi:hypothetical protein
MKTLPVLPAFVILLSGCASSKPMTACDMAATLYRSDRPDVHRQGDTWIQQGACAVH